jgi:hypothetical protein
MQLRLLSTMSEVATERNSTLIFPVPIELLRFLDRATPVMEQNQNVDRLTAGDQVE